MAVCPQVEYNSSPELQVKRLMRSGQESGWEKVNSEQGIVKNKVLMNLIILIYRMVSDKDRNIEYRMQKGVAPF